MLKAFREQSLRVVYLTVGPTLLDGSDYVKQAGMPCDGKKAPTSAHYPVGSLEHSVPDSVAPLPNELVINKTTPSAFTSTGIDHTLRSWRIDTLFVTGVVTNGCVANTARDASDRNYNVVLVEDACATRDMEMHYAEIRNFARTFGMVLVTKEVVEAIGASAG